MPPEGPERMPAALEHLRGTGIDVLDRSEDLAAYESPARGVPGRAAAVVRPGSVEQVRTTIRWARDHGVRLIPQGANSGLVGASTPTGTGTDVVLSTDRLTTTLSIDPADRTAVVSAGIRLSQLNSACAAHGLHLPIDLGADPSIGGMAATNTGGSRMVRYGDMRRQILGMRFVTADAGCSVVDEVSTLRKDNTGVKLWPLLVGSGGALGVITEVAVELTPLPQRRVTAWLLPTDDEKILPTIVALERSLGASLSALEVLSPAAFAAVGRLESAPRLPFGASPAGRVMLVEASGGDDIDDELLGALAALDGSLVPSETFLVPAADAWAVRHRVTEAIAHAGTVVGADISVPRSRLLDAVQTLKADFPAGLDEPGATLVDFGHWADGGVHCNVVVDRNTAEADRSAIRGRIFDVVTRLGGSYSSEHGLGPTNADRWTDTTSPERRRLLASVAEMFDPDAVLGHPGLPYR